MLSYVISIDASCSFALFIFFFNDTAPTEIYTTDTPFPYTTLFRSHISPWAAALGLMTGSAALLGSGAPLILYGPYLAPGVPTAPRNIHFDAKLRARHPDWGLPALERVKAAATQTGLVFADPPPVPANHPVLMFPHRLPSELHGTTHR